MTIASIPPSRPAPYRYPTPASAYGNVIPVVHGTGTTKGVLCYAGPVTMGYGPSIELLDDGTLQILHPTFSDGSYGSLDPQSYVCPSIFVFAQGAISGWLWIQRGDLTFDASGRLVFSDLGAWLGDWPVRTPVEPDLMLGNPATATEWPYACGTGPFPSLTVLGPEHRAPLGHLVALRHPALVLPEGRFPEFRAMLEGRLATHGMGGGTYMMAEPGAMIRDIVEDSVIGLGLGSDLVITDVGADGLAASSFDRYQTQNNWWLCRVWDSQSAASTAVNEIAEACDADLYWTGEALKLLPRGESVVGTYSPPTTAITFTDDDFLLSDSDSDPIEAIRVPEADIPTVIPVEFVPWMSLDGTTSMVESLDAARASLFGVRRGDTVTLKCIQVDTHARSISQLLAQRGIYNRTTFKWKASWRFIGVEPGDWALLQNTVMGLDQMVRVQSVEETEDGLYFEGVEWWVGVSVTAEGLPQGADGIGTNPLVPVDTTVFRTGLAGIANDSIFSVSEHSFAINCWNDLQGSSDGLVARASTAGVDSTAWTTALGDLGDYLNGGTTWMAGTPAWLTATSDIDLSGFGGASVWQAKWVDAYNARTDLQGAISGAAIEIAGKKNRVFYQVSEPADPTDGLALLTGDIWFDTDDGNQLYTWTGAEWVPGQVGPQGISGPQGVPGPAGASGPTGPQGVQGSQGVKGDVGPTGPTGPVGPSGPQGVVGPVGASGPTGPQGVDGAQGVQGSVGPSGPTGPVGPSGPQGVQGPVGASGPSGAQGGSGAQGVQGSVGPTGPTGPVGPSGPQGVQGNAGAVGATGVQGVQGAQGSAGSSMNWIGTWSSGHGTYSPNDAVIYNGANYVCIDTTTGGAGAPDTLPTKWLELATGAQGPQGPQGTQGSAGAQGSTGPQGVAGPQGSQGVAGAQGPTGPGGSTGPQGPQGGAGAQGGTGPTGVQGGQGPQGTAGAQGATGPQGSPGPQGSQGVAGPQGPTGPGGVQGPQGVQGVAGAQGSQGPQGSTGPQGSQGVAGSQGSTGPSGMQGQQGVQGVQGPQGSQGPMGPFGLRGGMVRCSMGSLWVRDGAGNNITAYAQVTLSRYASVLNGVNDTLRITLNGWPGYPAGTNRRNVAGVMTQGVGAGMGFYGTLAQWSPYSVGEDYIDYQLFYLNGTTWTGPIDLEPRYSYYVGVFFLGWNLWNQ